MKFSEIEADKWEELRPYLDTCIIPVTGLSGREQPNQVTEALERLRDLLDYIEIPFKGRVVTYPAFQYGGKEILPVINEVCHNLKASGFTYIVVVSASVEFLEEDLPAADFIMLGQEVQLNNNRDIAEYVKGNLLRLWNGDQ